MGGTRDGFRLATVDAREYVDTGEESEVVLLLATSKTVSHLRQRVEREVTGQHYVALTQHQGARYAFSCNKRNERLSAFFKVVVGAEYCQLHYAGSKSVCVAGA